jgi:decaprenylphospho-beta-D-ribofuranose 2-oxidase
VGGFGDRDHLSVSDREMTLLRTPAADSSPQGSALGPGGSRAVASAMDRALQAGIDRGVQRVSGWGRFPVESCRLYEPRDEADVAGLLGSRRDPSYIARGLGRSYGDAAVNKNAAAVSLLQLDRIFSFDSDSGVLDCEAGLSLHEIIRYALPRGFFLPVTPGTRLVTVGGAIAADVHGKNHHRAGSFSNFVTDLELLTPAGDRVECSPEQAPEVFWATVGGMGLTGFITRARIRLRAVESAYVVVRFEKAKDLAEALELLAEGDRQYEYSVAWVDCIASGAKRGRSVLMVGRHAAASELPKTIREPLALPRRRGFDVPFALPATPLRPWTVRAFNAVYFASKPAASERLVDLDRFFYPLDSIRNWNRLYGRRGFVQYQVVVPHSEAQPAFTSMLRRIRESGRAAFLGVLKRFGQASRGLLSFPMPGATLALDIAVDRHLPAFLQELDALIIDRGGRVYLAKDATLSPENFARSYPRLDEFRAVKQQVDPRGLVSSSLARRLKIADV